jgi:hypothetical protein
VCYSIDTRRGRQRETDMKIDADGMARVDLVWSIEGTDGRREGTLYELHEAEVAVARGQILRLARRGDTVEIRTV